MRSRPRFLSIGILAFILLSGIASLAAATDTQPDITQHSRIVQIDIYVISVGNFEFTKGTYTIDFYLMFKWQNGTIDPTGFELMNGRAATKDKIYEDITNTTNEVWYRVSANLFITPTFTNYPLDSQDLKIILEDTKYNASILEYTPALVASGVDTDFTLAGWDISSSNLSTSIHEYPWGENYSQTVFTVTLARQPGPTILKILLPPIIFCIVSGLSFFFKADKITHRLGLGTSMLISAVMFHLSQTASLPALPSLILIDEIMISVYAFLAASLFATTLIYIDDEYWKNVDYTRQVNSFGAIFTIVLPFIVFAILYYG